MSELKFTRAQEQAIALRNSDLLVSASAGSGKTTVMIERIVALLSEGACLENMAVCTYTKAAAADMRDKLTRRLSEKAATDPKIYAQLKKLPQAEISTLHSWCTRVIKAYFYASRLDPAFEILDETQAQMLLCESIEQAIESAIQTGDADFLRLYEVLLSSRKHTKLNEMIKRICQFCEVQPDPDAYLAQQSAPCDDHDACIKLLAEHYSRRNARFAERAKTLLNVLTDAGFTADAVAAEGLYDYIIGRAVEPPRTPTLKKSSHFAALHEDYKRLKSDYTKFAAERVDALTLPSADATMPYVKQLCILTQSALSRYAEAKRKRAYADYADLEHETLRILNSEYAGEVREKYRYVFVDEYQDVNPLQDAILSRLNGSLFFVGDVKQSIYGFRMCAPRYFSEKRLRYKSEGVGTNLELNANFRSDGRILNLVNEVFSRIMTTDFGGVDYAADAMFEHSGRQLYSPAVTVKLVDCRSDEAPDEDNNCFGEDEKAQNEEVNDGSTGKKSGEVYGILTHEYIDDETESELETNLVAEHVAELLNSNVQENGKVRPVAFSDIAILVRSRDRYADKLLKKLKAAGIPAAFTDKTSALSRRSTSALLTFLRLIDNSADDIAFAAVLRSHYGGFSDDELADIRLCVGAEPLFYEAVQICAEEDSPLKSMGKENSSGTIGRLKQFFAKLNRYRALAQSVRADELAGTVVAENNAFNYAAALGGETECAVLSAYLNHLADCPFAVSLHEYLTYAGDGDIPLSVAPDARSVRVMTVHASKGLEFPFVLLCNLNKKMNRRDLTGEMLLTANKGISLKCFDWNKRKIGETSRSRCEKIGQRKAMDEEEMRVLYVAMTRAKYHLALFGALPTGKTVPPPNEASSYMDWLYPVIGKLAEVRKREACNFGAMPMRRNSVFGKPDRLLTNKIARHINFAFTKSPLPIKTNVTKLIEQAGIEELLAKTVYSSAGDNDDRAIDKGNAYHKIMQHIDFFAPFESEWTRLCALLPESVALADKKKILAAAKAIEPLASGAEVFREQAFVLCAKNADNAPEQLCQTQLVQGVIDLLIIRGDEAEVVDYKTTRPEALTGAAYKMQMDVYCEAVERILKKKVTKRRLYAFACDNFVEI